MLPKNQPFSASDDTVTLYAGNYMQIYLIPCLMLPFSEATVLRFSAK